MTNPAIAVANVTRSFGSVTALNDVTLSVAPNEICGLLGANGAGKTTLMSIIAGHDQPSSGHVTVHGHTPFESAAVARDMCFIRDNQRYPDDYTLKHALRIAQGFHPGWDTDRAHQLAEKFSLPSSTIIKKFSRGQLSALAITLTLASRASVTIFDEPYLGLDVSARHKFYELLIEEYTNHPRTIVLSTHLVGEMQSIFDRIVVLNKGVVALDVAADDATHLGYELLGPAAELTTWAHGSPALSMRTVGSLASATFLGEPPQQLPERLDVRPLPLQDLVAAIGDSSQGA